MASDAVDTLSTLRTFIASGVSSFDVKYQFPDETTDPSKTLLRLELVGTQDAGWVGGYALQTGTIGMVDKTEQTTYLVRVEAWGRGLASALGAARDARNRLVQNKAALLAASGLHYQNIGTLRTFPFDPRYADWDRVGFLFTAYRDEVWQESA